VLGHELSRLDRPGLSNHLLDLGQLAARLGLKAKPSLPTLAAAVGLTHPRPYRPAADARVTARLAGRLLALAEAGGLARAEALFVRPECAPRGALLRPDPPAAPAGPGVYLLQDAAGQVIETHSISAGLDYPGVGPEHAYLKDLGRARYVSVTDTQAMDAFQLLCRTEGIIPALESAHAISAAVDLARTLLPEDVVLVNLSGRGDKDMGTVADVLGVTL